MYEQTLYRADEPDVLWDFSTRLLVQRVGGYSTLIALAWLVENYQLFGAESPLYLATGLGGIVASLLAVPGAVELFKRGMLWWQTRGYRAGSGRPSAGRGQVQVPDAILAVVVLVAVIALAPSLYQFVNMAAAEADPFSALLLRLTPSLLILGLIISVGVSARRGS